VTGFTGSGNFPTAHAIQGTLHGVYDAFVTKFNSDGSALVYATYLGGSGVEGGSGIAVDAAGNAYVTGNTDSTDFPTKNAIQPAFGGGTADAFVTKINAAGSALVYSTYLGGSSSDGGSGIAVDAAGNSYVTGFTRSADFPTFNAIQPTLGSSSLNGFATKINAGGSAFVYSTYLGYFDFVQGSGIGADSAGNAYVTGADGNAGGYYAVFITEINTGGSALVYSEDLGPGQGNGIAVDSAGSAYVTGPTPANATFWITPFAFQQSSKGGGDAIVVKIAGQTFVSFKPTKLAFANQVIGHTSFPKKLTLTNQGSGTLTIHKVLFGGLDPGEFSETNTCGAPVAAGASCTISVTFTPSAKNVRQAEMGISDSDPASPQAIPLSGSGTVVSLSPNKLVFGNQPVGTTSAPQNVTLTNTASTQLNFSGIHITGVNHADFSETNTCGTSIAAKASCTITVTFTPTATGTRKAAVSVSDDGGSSPQTVGLTGTGT
jgi:Abnormal spindle-like microcephaly-assoc'd, ASPM-SPD-2-Hydin/Beta-propeller repeat